MKVVIGNCKAQNVDAILMNHKVRLGNKYAFLFNKEVIGKAKNNLFSRPPKRTITADLDAKLEDEANTSTGSGESDCMVVTGDNVNKVISAGVEEQAATTKKLLEDLLSFEEYLGFTGLVGPDSVREMRKLTRFLIANALHKKTEFKNTTSESISLAAILLASEKFELDLSKVMDFISNNIKPRTFNKPQRIRETRAYSLLGEIAESSKLMPNSP